MSSDQPRYGSTFSVPRSLSVNAGKCSRTIYGVQKTVYVSQQVRNTRHGAEERTVVCAGGRPAASGLSARLWSTCPATLIASRECCRQVSARELPARRPAPFFHAEP